MQDQRRHQRIRFGAPPSVKIGFGGVVGEGHIENLSLSGLMVRSSMNLEIGRLAGCEFSIFCSPLIDVPVTIVSRVGDLYGARFQTGPINRSSSKTPLMQRSPKVRPQFSVFMNLTGTR